MITEMNQNIMELTDPLERVFNDDVMLKVMEITLIVENDGLEIKEKPRSGWEEERRDQKRKTWSRHG